jgi:hypothetical protein
MHICQLYTTRARKPLGRYHPKPGDRRSDHECRLWSMPSGGLGDWEERIAAVQLVGPMGQPAVSKARC